MGARLGRNARSIKFTVLIDLSRMVMHGLAMARKKISTTVYITPEQNDLLKLLHQKTRVPVAEYIRQGIDLVLEKERDHLPGQLTFEVPRR
jgi:hypothetical protein